MSFCVEIFDHKKPENGLVTVEVDDIKTKENTLLDTISYTCESALENSDPQIKYHTSILETLVNEITLLSSSDFCAVFCEDDKIMSNSSQLKCLFLCELKPGTFCAGSNYTKTQLKESDNIFGYVMKKCIAVISTNIIDDPRSKIKNHANFPPNHPVVTPFLAIPLLSKSTKQSSKQNCIGLLVMGCVSATTEYTVEKIKKLLPVIKLVNAVTRKIFQSKNKIGDEVTRISSTDDIKDQFLATMSHEIRTPLNGIMGMVTMLVDAGPLNPKQTTYVKTLTECVFQLSNLMNNILDFSKMSSNRFYLLKQPFSLLDSISDAFKMIEGGALVKGLMLKKELPEHNSIPRLVGDSQRLTQILSNLLGNAVKFTEKGSILLRVTCKEIALSDTENNYVKKINVSFEVSDTGVGVPIEEQSKIFEVFHQSPSLSTYMSNSGTGLGLSISRELVRLMGGRINVRSEGINGKGSVFSFSVVLDAEISEFSLSSDTTKLLKKSKVLAVDDRPEIRLQLTEMLIKWGCIPFVVSGAEDGLKYVKCGMDFDTIIVDMCMPYMSGTEMAQELRRDAPNVPLIGISSIEINSGEKYFDVFLYKPITQNTLFPALLKCLTKKKNNDLKKSQPIKRIDSKCTTPRELKNSAKRKESYKRMEIASLDEKEYQEDHHREKQIHRENILRERISQEKIHQNKKYPKDLKILVAEDEKNNAFTIMEMLNNMGFIICERVENGKDCIEKVKTEKWDVVLMDIRMPIMDGIEATRHIRAAKNPPYIIAISAGVLNSDKERCQTAGIDAYLPKPITKESLKVALAPLIKNHKVRAQAATHS